MRIWQFGAQLKYIFLVYVTWAQEPVSLFSI